jgi:Na+-translocating ferredoxin:NAD+ oxidoreductase RnfD subunit
MKNRAALKLRITAFIIVTVLLLFTVIIIPMLPFWATVVVSIFNCFIAAVLLLVIDKHHKQ